MAAIVSVGTRLKSGEILVWGLAAMLALWSAIALVPHLLLVDPRFPGGVWILLILHIPAVALLTPMTWYLKHPFGLELADVAFAAIALPIVYAAIFAYSLATWRALLLAGAYALAPLVARVRILQTSV